MAMATDDNNYGADFDDDVSFLNDAGEGDALVLPPPVSQPQQSQEIESIVLLPKKDGQRNEDLQDDNTFEADGMDAYDEIFLQVDDGSEEIVKPRHSEISGTPKQIDDSKTATSYFLTPASNFSVTPPDFDDSDSDDELLAHIDLDITSLSSQHTSAAEVSAFTVDPSTPLDKTAATIPGSYVSVPSKNNTRASCSTQMTSKSNTAQREGETAFREDSHTNDTSVARSKLRARRSNPSRKTPAARRFPGPAGLLPHLKPVEFRCLDSPKSSNPVSRKIHDIIASHQNQLPPAASQLSSQVVYCSQEEGSFFERQTWMELMLQLKLNSEDVDSDSPLNLMNIDWIRTRATRLPGCRKVPFLAAVIHEAPELVSGRMGGFKAPCVTLTDATGSIDAAVDPNFLNAYFADLVPGTAIALKNVGLLRVSKRHLMLTITEQNVICMTSQYETDDEQNQARGPSSRDKRNKARHVILTEEGVRVTEFCDFHPEKVLELYFKMNSALEDENEIEDDDQPEVNSAHPSAIRPISLFTTTHRASGSGFIAPRTSGNMFISNRTAPAANPITNTTVNNDNSSDFGDDDDDAFFQALELGFGTDDF